MPRRVGWRRVAIGAVATLAVLVVLAGCSGSDDDPSASSTGEATTTTVADQGEGLLGDVRARGRASLDGEPLTAEFLGAVVVGDDGLVTPCQAEIPAVDDGRYSIVVLAEHHGAGCGRPGSEIAVWTYVGDQRTFAAERIPWPDGERASADLTFATKDPLGAGVEGLGIFGSALDAAGDPLPTDTVVEAYIGSTRCAVASTRLAGDFDGYVMTLVGSDQVEGCDPAATPTFRVGGAPATPSRDPRSAGRDPVDLTLGG